MSYLVKGFFKKNYLHSNGFMNYWHDLIFRSETSYRKRRFDEAHWECPKSNNPHGWEIAEPYGKMMACPLIFTFVGRFIQSFCLSLVLSFSVMLTNSFVFWLGQKFILKG